jgi:dolichyl-phosphate beta-glucosyltransferase
MSELKRRAAGRCAIVVPCYNESARLDTAAFLAYAASHPEIQFVFVNDGSKDDTIGLLRRMQEKNPSIEVLDKSPNGGKAEAVRDGMRHGLRMEGIKIVGFWDADLATPLESIADLHHVMETSPGIDIVIGARVKLLGRQIERKAVRHYLGRIFATFASMTLELPIYDTQCGAKLFRVTPTLDSVLEKPFLSRWIFDVELIARLVQVQPRSGKLVRDCLYEFPLSHWRDVPGSKLKSGDFIKAIRELWEIRREYFR